MKSFILSPSPGPNLHPINSDGLAPYKGYKCLEKVSKNITLKDFFLGMLVAFIYVALIWFMLADAYSSRFQGKDNEGDD